MKSNTGMINERWIKGTMLLYGISRDSAIARWNEMQEKRLLKTKP